jgi:hypothetical protein
MTTTIQNTEYFYIRQKRGRKRVYAIHYGDHTTFARYICGFPTEQAAKAYCREHNDELRKQSWR